MAENVLLTETDGKYVRRQTLKGIGVLFVVLSGLSCLGLFLGWQTFAFFEAIVVISCAYAAMSAKNKSHSYSLRFEGNRLYITDDTLGESHEVFDVSREDFVINQTPGERKNNYCSMMIKNTVFTFGGLKNCDEIRSYIDKNFGDCKNEL